MTKKFLLGMAAALALLIALPEVASAQYGPPRGPRFGYRHRPHMYVGGHLMGLFIANETAGGDYAYLGQGGGGGLFVGFRLSPFFGLEGDGTITYHDEQYDIDGTVSSLYLLTLSLNGKIFIPTFGPMEPYFQGGVGYSYRGIVWDDGWGGTESVPSGNGPSFNLGGGIDFHLGSQLSVGARLLYHGYYFFKVGSPSGQGVDVADYISGISFDLNAAFHF